MLSMVLKWQLMKKNPTKKKTPFILGALALFAHTLPCPCDLLVVFHALLMFDLVSYMRTLHSYLIGAIFGFMERTHAAMAK